MFQDEVDELWAVDEAEIALGLLELPCCGVIVPEAKISNPNSPLPTLP